MSPGAPTIDHIRAARERIAGLAHLTPVMTCGSIDELVGARVSFKCEHLQRGGAFKFRGAANAVFSLDDATAARGVAAHSSGNHAAALALAATARRIACHVVMPTTTPQVKQRAVRRNGARVVLCEPTLEARASRLREVLAETGATEIHPFDEPAVIAGQGTATLELLEQAPGVEAVIAPVSGGGLLSGTAIAAHGTDPSIRIWGAEPAGADDAFRSLASGTLQTDTAGATMADGLLATLSPRTFAILRAHAVEVVTVSEPEIVDGMTLVYERLKQVIEPSAGVAVAALVRLGQEARLPDHVGVILSGGNLDLHHLPFAADER